eukprot:5862444-Amphidinium_carterae.1
MDLWLFCAHLLHHPAESAADAEHSTGAAAEREEELEELDQIRPSFLWDDPRRASSPAPFHKTLLH